MIGQAGKGQDFAIYEPKISEGEATLSFILGLPDPTTKRLLDHLKDFVREIDREGFTKAIYSLSIEMSGGGGSFDNFASLARWSKGHPISNLIDLWKERLDKDELEAFEKEIFRA